MIRNAIIAFVALFTTAGTLSATVNILDAQVQTQVA